MYGKKQEIFWGIVMVVAIVAIIVIANVIIANVLGEDEISNQASFENTRVVEETDNSQENSTSRLW